MDPPVFLIGLVRASPCIAKGLPLDALWDDVGVLIYSLIISKGFLMGRLWIPCICPQDVLWIPHGFIVNPTCASHGPSMDSQLIFGGFLIDCWKPWIPNELVIASNGFPTDSLWMPYGFCLHSL